MAYAYRGVSHITFPVDLQEKELKERQRSPRNVPHHTSDVDARSARLPHRMDIEKAAEILNVGKKVAILAGRGALDSTDELEQLAELLGAPIVKPLLGKAAVPDDSPYTTGGHWFIGYKTIPGGNGRLRHIANGGNFFPLHRIPAQAGSRLAECRLSSIPRELACVFPWR